MQDKLKNWVTKRRVFPIKLKTHGFMNFGKQCFLNNIHQQLWIYAILMIFIVSCQKHDSSPYPKSIYGKWNWIKTYSVRPLDDTNPLTPGNTGNFEYIVFQKDRTWYSSINNIKADSGRFLLGQGTYNAYPGAKVHVFDSIAYYTVEGIALNKCDFYEIRNDTLQFSPGYGGRFTSYTLPYNGSKIWVKDSK